MTIRQRLGRSLVVAAGIGLTAIVLTATGAGPAIAQSARPLLALIVNDTSRPVPVQIVGSTRTRLGPADVVQRLRPTAGDGRILLNGYLVAPE